MIDTRTVCNNPKTMVSVSDLVMIPSRVILVGYRGTGKSTVGQQLASRMGWDFQDADVVLEKHAGRSITQIFAQDGEQVFRDLESQILGELLTCDQRVLATGGGVVLRPENRTRLKQAGRVVWLRASPQTIYQRIQEDQSTAQRRPNLTTGGLDEIVHLLQVREPLYREVAQVIVSTEDLSPDVIVNRILAELAWPELPR